MDDTNFYSLEKDFPLIKEIKALNEVFWINPKYESFETIKNKLQISEEDVKDAEDRLNRFAPYIKSTFPETNKLNGIIESPISRIPNMKKYMEKDLETKIFGNLLVKLDSNLPIAGSIKARGGIYEVLKHAENLALNEGLLSKNDNYSKINSNIFRNFYSKYTIQVVVLETLV